MTFCLCYNELVPRTLKRDMLFYICYYCEFDCWCLCNVWKRVFHFCLKPAYTETLKPLICDCISLLSLLSSVFFRLRNYGLAINDRLNFAKKCAMSRKISTIAILVAQSLRVFRGEHALLPPSCLPREHTYCLHNIWSSPSMGYLWQLCSVVSGGVSFQIVHTIFIRNPARSLFWYVKALRPIAKPPTKEEKERWSREKDKINIWKLTSCTTQAKKTKVRRSMFYRLLEWIKICGIEYLDSR